MKVVMILGIVLILGTPALADRGSPPTAVPIIEKAKAPTEVPLQPVTGKKKCMPYWELGANGECTPPHYPEE